MSVNNKLKEIFQGDDTVKLIRSFVRWFFHIERMQSRRMPKEIEQLQWKEQEKEEYHIKCGETWFKRA